MGFLSAWDANERIDVSELAGDLPGTWWVDVKKCLNHGEADELLNRLLDDSLKIDEGGEVKSTLTTSRSVGYQADIVAASIVQWNLTDQNDVVLPYERDESLKDPLETIKASLKLVPASVYDRLAKVVIPANTEKKGETASFRHDRDGGNSDGEHYSANDREVLV
jgi:hypothetical protein